MVEPLKKLEELCGNIGGEWSWDDWNKKYVCNTKGYKGIDILKKNGGEIMRALAEAHESGLKDMVEFRADLGKLGYGYNKEVSIVASPENRKSIPIVVSIESEHTKDMEKVDKWSLSLAKIWREGKVRGGRKMRVWGEPVEEGWWIRGWASARMDVPLRDAKKLTNRGVSSLIDFVMNQAKDTAEEVVWRVPSARKEE